MGLRSLPSRASFQAPYVHESRSKGFENIDEGRHWQLPITQKRNETGGFRWLNGLRSRVGSITNNNKTIYARAFVTASPSKTRSRSAPVSSSPGQLSGYFKVKPNAMLRYRIELWRLTSSNLPSYFWWSQRKVSLVKTPFQRDLRTLMERLNSHGQSNGNGNCSSAKFSLTES